SIGKAVLDQTKPAARKRSKPCAMLIAIISTAMIASSTSRPSTSTSAPSEILCRTMSNHSMTVKVIASTSGIDTATSRPVRKPSARGQRTAQADRALAQVAHARCGLIGETAGDGGEVAQTDGAITGVDRERTDILHRAERAVHAQLEAVGRSLEEARRHHRVLLRQRLLHGLDRDPKRGQAGVADLDPDPLVLQPDQLHLADVGDARKLGLQAVGVVLEHGVVKTLAGERVDVPERVAELVVEERADHALGQGRADVTDLLAHLVPELGHVARAHR